MLESARPVAYIRRSVARRGDPGDVSREFQTVKVRGLAGVDGPSLRILDGDWGRSASTDKTDQRTAFLALLEEIEHGSISHVYAYSPDRLARSVEWSARLVNACRRAGVPITTTAGTVAPDDPAARAMFNMLAVMNETALDEMERKARASAQTRKARGGPTGGRAYGEVRTIKTGEVRGADEDAEMVVSVYREAGSYFEAARRLNERHVPTRSGRQWYPRTVQRIVNRQDPTTVRGGRRGARSSSPSHCFSGLLRCHCGTTMGRTVSGEGTPRYRCSRGASDPAHTRPYIVSERSLLPWAKDEAAHLILPTGRLVFGPDNPAKREALEEQRVGIGDALAIGAYTKEEAALKLADVLAALDELGLEETSVAWAGAPVAWPDDPRTNPLELEATPQDVNQRLRAMWKYVQLGPDLRPVAAVWYRPAWRRP